MENHRSAVDARGTSAVPQGGGLVPGHDRAAKLPQAGQGRALQLHVRPSRQRDGDGLLKMKHIVAAALVAVSASMVLARGRSQELYARASGWCRSTCGSLTDD